MHIAARYYSSGFLSFSINTRGCLVFHESRYRSAIVCSTISSFLERRTRGAPPGPVSLSRFHLPHIHIIKLTDNLVGPYPARHHTKGWRAGQYVRIRIRLCLSAPALYLNACTACFESHPPSTSTTRPAGCVVHMTPEYTHAKRHSCGSCVCLSRMTTAAGTDVCEERGEGGRNKEDARMPLGMPSVSVGDWLHMRTRAGQGFSLTSSETRSHDHSKFLAKTVPAASVVLT